MKNFAPFIMAMLMTFDGFCVSAGEKAAGKRDFRFVTAASRKTAIYRRGEKITLSVKLAENGKPAENLLLQLVASINGKTVKEWFADAGEGGSFSTALVRPGWVALRGFVCGRDKKKLSAGQGGCTGGIGAVTAPEELVPGRPAPADFRAFWAKQRAELDQIPVRELSRVRVAMPRTQQGKINCWDVKVACAGNAPVSGYLCIPVNAKPKSLPAIIRYHGAGVFSSQKRFHPKAIWFEVNAHGIDNGRPAAYYADLKNGTLRDYRHAGKMSRDTFYFKNMFLRVMRAMDYVMSLPEWDGKILIVHGGSQGGGQSIAAAALNPRVTFCRAAIPALCDHGGEFAGRMAGWPRGSTRCRTAKPICRSAPGPPITSTTAISLQ